MPNANLFTGEEILARLEALKSDIAGDTTITIAALEDKLATVEALAKGRSRAISYADNAAANAGLAAMSKSFQLYCAWLYRMRQICDSPIRIKFLQII